MIITPDLISLHDRSAARHRRDDGNFVAGSHPTFGSGQVTVHPYPAGREELLEPRSELCRGHGNYLGDGVAGNIGAGSPCRFPNRSEVPKPR
jgi:hypothetical protein